MFERSQIERFRDDRLNPIMEGDLLPTVAVSAWAGPLSCGATADIWDSDGDSIALEAIPDFVMPGEADCRLYFAQGADRHWVARTLRKCADMLEGERGDAIVNVGIEPGDLDRGRRLEDGNVVLFSGFRDMDRWHSLYTDVP